MFVLADEERSDGNSGWDGGESCPDPHAPPDTSATVMIDSIAALRSTTHLPREWPNPIKDLHPVPSATCASQVRIHTCAPLGAYLEASAGLFGTRI
ncbi:hypothetical protein Vau01_119060 [Virgisporangium aurantiacum]|uniref:Uncharacterized protein n=1 Tax=Virgisporangium aurantiacum TaxID=175570 RepID=A0A8J4E6S0_9ACTN|nr:hypothetical protein Vau01_119060 [Virgisporangium aurantiacum]